MLEVKLTQADPAVLEVGSPFIWWADAPNSTRDRCSNRNELSFNFTVKRGCVVDDNRITFISHDKHEMDTDYMCRVLLAYCTMNKCEYLLPTCNLEKLQEFVREL